MSPTNCIILAGAMVMGCLFGYEYDTSYSRQIYSGGQLGGCCIIDANLIDHPPKIAFNHVFKILTQSILGPKSTSNNAVAQCVSIPLGSSRAIVHLIYLS